MTASLRVAIVHLDGNVETSGAKLAAPGTLLPLDQRFSSMDADCAEDRKKLAEVSARLCRLLRDEVIEQMALGNPGLTGLAQDWRKLLFPQANDAQFADGYAQAVTFGLLVARARDIPLSGGTEMAAQELRKTNSLIGTALRLLTDDAFESRSAKDIAWNADASAERGQLAHHQQGQAGSLALFLRGLSGNLRQPLAQADRFLLHAAGSGFSDGQSGR